MRTVLNVIWFVLSGLWFALGYALAGALMCLLVVTIPFGVAAFRLAGFIAWPFGRKIVNRSGAGAPSLLGNVLWFLLAGVWIAVGHVVSAVALALTVIGIPFAVAHLKFAAAALAPLGKQVVPSDDPRPYVLF